MSTTTVTPELEYEVRILQKRHSPYMEYPSHVHLETMAYCNAACGFCMCIWKRWLTVMPLAGFARIRNSSGKGRG